jgi:hypothetical protein
MFSPLVDRGIAVTSWEALITPSPPNIYEGGGWFVGWWTEPMHAGWGTISWYIARYIPRDYQNAAHIGVSLYLIFAFFLLFFRSYRIWIPAGLFLLPAWLFWVVSQPLKVVYLLAVKVPLMVLHYLHYLMVPHPAEEVYKNGMARGVPLPKLARDVARAMYVHDLNIYNRPHLY